MRPWIALFCLTALTSVANSQDRAEINLEQFAEERFQIQDAEVDYETLYETLLLYHSSPLNLNKTERDELAALYILNPAQLNAFFQYRDQFGSFLSIYELQAIPGFDSETIHQLKPFIDIKQKNDPRPLAKRIFTEKNNYLLLRYGTNLPYQRGDNFQGDSNHLYGRFRVQHSNDFSIGFTFEKDAGESFTWNPSKRQHGFDFYSGHIMVNNQGIFKTLLVGDFQMQFGQGLVYGSGFSVGKGAETTNSVMRNNLGIRPYSSVQESGFFRGLGATFKINHLESTLFFSYNHLDGRRISDTTYSDFEEFFHGIQTSGYHRTPGEIQAKDEIQEMATGYGITYKVNRELTVGAAGLYTQYSVPIEKKPTNYNQYEFSGYRNWLSSIFANYNWQNFMLFGECAISQSGGTGAIAGFISSLSSQVDFSWLVRHYDKNFHSEYSSGFGENSRTINENGMYWGLKYRPSKKYEFAIYFDRFSFPWLKYQVEAPSRGYEYLSRITFKPKRSTTLYLQFREERKEKTQHNESSNLNQLTQLIRRNYLLNLDLEINRFFQLKTRVQGSSYKEGSSWTSGFAILQDLNLSLGKIKLSTRFALFDTENYANRQYVYERDVLYSFSVPAYNGTGSRTYFLIQYPLSKKMKIYIRYATYDFVEKNLVTTGWSQPRKSYQSQVKCMLKLSI